MNRSKIYTSRRLLSTLKNTTLVGTIPLSHFVTMNDFFFFFYICLDKFVQFINYTKIAKKCFRISYFIAKRFILTTVTRRSYGIRFARFSINGEQPRASFAGWKSAYRATIKTESEPVNCHRSMPSNHQNTIRKERGIYFSLTIFSFKVIKRN